MRELQSIMTRTVNDWERFHMTRAISWKQMIAGALFFAVLVLMIAAAPAQCQTQLQKVWIAGRHDGNRVIIYFNAVHFGESALQSLNLPLITPPVAPGFLIVASVPVKDIASFEKEVLPSINAGE